MKSLLHLEWMFYWISFRLNLIQICVVPVSTTTPSPPPPHRYLHHIVAAHVLQKQIQDEPSSWCFVIIYMTMKIVLNFFCVFLFVGEWRNDATFNKVVMTFSKWNNGLTTVWAYSFVAVFCTWLSDKQINSHLPLSCVLGWGAAARSNLFI